MFSSKNFMVSDFTLRSLIPFECIFVYGKVVYGKYMYMESSPV